MESLEYEYLWLSRWNRSSALQRQVHFQRCRKLWKSTTLWRRLHLGSKFLPSARISQMFLSRLHQARASSTYASTRIGWMRLFWLFWWISKCTDGFPGRFTILSSYLKIRIFDKKPNFWILIFNYFSWNFFVWFWLKLSHFPLSKNIGFENF